jgi:pyruvate, water dikinase
MKDIIELRKVNTSHVSIVGGKNASIGEMIQNLSGKGINVPGGFATTVSAYEKFLSQDGLNITIDRLLSSIKLNDINALRKTSEKIRHLILSTPFTPEFEHEIDIAYAKLHAPSVAVRSSAIAEDSNQASFAGMQETYLNVKGIKNVLQAIKLVFASLFTSRAILYRQEQGFKHEECGLSVGIMPMIRSDKGVSGVLFTLDTESGFDKVLVISAAYGLGEGIVQGHVNADEFIIYKPNIEAGKLAILQRKLGEKSDMMVYTHSTKPKDSLKMVKVPDKKRHVFCINDKEMESLARQALMIEKHYGMPMDIEWAKDGIDGKIYILQARPETVSSKAKNAKKIEHYALIKKGKKLVEGQSIGQRIGQGRARIMLDIKKSAMIKPGDVLVTDMTDPDWEPIMKTASAIITNRGGRTCHAAIIARELGIPAIVGCTNATKKIRDKQSVTVACHEGLTGHVYDGILPYKVSAIEIETMPILPIKVLLNVGNPEKAFFRQFLPNDGVGLARLEFIINDMIGLHPNAALHVDTLPAVLKKQILAKTAAYKNPVDFYVEKLREGIAMIAAAFYPKEVIFRFSDFKSNEYANLLGGDVYEPLEENPMIGFRGASRYKDPRFKKCFELECKAFKRVRDKMDLTNAQLMVPFVRTVSEIKQVINLIETYGLKRGVNGLKIYMMCEIPSNVILAEEFLNYVDGFSIGSNDLTQLTLGLDRDSHLVSSLFDERNEAVKSMLHHVISVCRSKNKYIGICGQAPSDHPDLAEWLMKEGIESMSLNPDTIVETWLMLAKHVVR